MKQARGRINPAVAILLAIVGFALLLLNSGGWFWGGPWIHNSRDWFHFPFFPLLGFSTVIQLALGVWVGVDAQRRGSNGYLWGLLVFFTPVIGLIVYLLWAGDVIERISQQANSAPETVATAGPVEPDLACESCGTELEEGFKVCPACGASLCCPACGKRVRPGWKLCPWCASSLEHGG